MKNALLITAMLALIAGQAATATDMYAYPKQGQSTEQQSRDDYECHRWANRQSGYDARSSTNSSDQTAASTGRGVLRGALVGLAIGEIADGKGGEGAAIGGLLGGMRGHSAGRQQAQYDAASARNDLNRAYKACMEARGYSVN